MNKKGDVLSAKLWAVAIGIVVALLIGYVFLHRILATIPGPK